MMQYQCHVNFGGTGITCTSRFHLNRIVFTWTPHPDYPEQPPVNTHIFDSLLAYYRDRTPRRRLGLTYACDAHLDAAREWAADLAERGTRVEVSRSDPCGRCGGIGGGQDLLSVGIEPVQGQTNGVGWIVHECESCEGRGSVPCAHEAS